MSNQLHILNGDATLNVFNKTGIDGDVMVWREVLSEGPLSATLDARFWQQREDWITRVFNATADEGYKHKVLHELEKLNKPYTNITLWFEYDLHCQVNMLGVMQLLQQEIDLTQPPIYLICPDGVAGVPNFRGMGQLNGEQLEALYDNRLHLTTYDFTIAAEAWQKYILFNAEALQQWIDETTFWGSMHLLKPALQAQVKRLQVNSNGLGYIGQKLLELYQQGITTRTKIYEAFWQQEPIYGMGDAELDFYLSELQAKGFVNL